MSAAFEPFGWWPLVFVGLVPMVVGQYRLLPAGWSVLAPMITAAVYWLGTFGRAFVQTAPLAAVALPLAAAVLVAVVAAGDRSFNERTGFRWFVLGVPVLWAGLDALRQSFFLTGTTGYLAYAMAPVPWLVQPISVLGISALNLLILLVNYTVALVVLSVLEHRSNVGTQAGWRPIAVTCGVVSLVLVFWAGAGLFIKKSMIESLGPVVRVAAVQPGPLSGGGFGDQASNTESPELLDHLATQTRAAAAQGAELVVWPEEILTYNPVDTSHANRAFLQDLVRQTGVYLVLGFEDPTGDVVVNKATIVAPNGGFLGTYTKTHPVVLDDDDFPAGNSYPSWSTELGHLGIIICFDYAFEDPARFVTLSGAQILAVPAWDWGGLANLRPWTVLQFRVIENRVPAVKADHAWDSAIIDATGDVVAATDDDTTLGSPALLVGDVHLGPRNAPVTDLGDWSGFLLIVAAGVLLAGHTRLVLYPRWRSRGRRKPPRWEPPAPH